MTNWWIWMLPAGLLRARISLIEFWASLHDSFPAPPGLPRVHFLCGVTEVLKPERWVFKSSGGIHLSRQQLPLKLAWAISIHKSQVRMGTITWLLTGILRQVTKRMSALRGFLLREWLAFEPKPKLCHFYLPICLKMSRPWSRDTIILCILVIHSTEREDVGDANNSDSMAAFFHNVLWIHKLHYIKGGSPFKETSLWKFRPNKKADKVSPPLL